MGLRETARADLRAILEDTEGGFGWPITITNPDGVTADLTGFSTDIGMTIDMDTGLPVSGRSASVALPIAALTEAALGLPRGIADSSRAPWLVTFLDIEGASHTFKVFQAMPDLAIGIVTCVLEAYLP